ncbi:hypothetical protein J6590_096072 [Homalodisca vitripennis]|nr:hypothetical protein J6590_007675 [Homalodisca vitripennis]KAG8329057.1 hypothetical protein J6590_096072 [Homalodisca vitripennis]
MNRLATRASIRSGNCLSPTVKDLYSRTLTRTRASSRSQQYLRDYFLLKYPLSLTLLVKASYDLYHPYSDISGKAVSFLLTPGPSAHQRALIMVELFPNTLKLHYNEVFDSLGLTLRG